MNFVGGVRPEGICPCTASMTDPGLWNASAGKRWNHLRTLLRRSYPSLQFMRANEFQQRGLIHMHISVAYLEVIDWDHVRRLAIRCGFGCSTQFASSVNPGYVAKYVTKSLDDAASMPWSRVDEETGEVLPVHTPRLRTWSASRGWGVTMKELLAVYRAEAERRAAALAALDPPAPTPADSEPPALVPTG